MQVDHPDIRIPVGTILQFSVNQDVYQLIHYVFQILDKHLLPEIFVVVELKRTFRDFRYSEQTTNRINCCQKTAINFGHLMVTHGVLTPQVLQLGDHGTEKFVFVIYHGATFGGL